MLVARWLLVGGVCLWCSISVGAGAKDKKEPDRKLPPPKELETLTSSRSLVTSDITWEKAALRGIEVLRATALSEPEVIARFGAHRSTRMGDIVGGGMTSSAHCRQKFAAAELLAGVGALGERTLEYTHLESARGFPLPSPTRPIARGEKVVLVLGADGSLVKVIPDTEACRKEIDAIVDHIKNRPPAVTALLRGAEAFVLKLEHHGPRSKTHQSFYWTNERDLPKTIPPDWVIEHNLSGYWVHQAIDHFAATGLLTPENIRAEKARPTPAEPYYSLIVSAKGSDSFTFHLGWGREAHDAIDALAKAMNYEGTALGTVLKHLK